MAPNRELQGKPAVLETSDEMKKQRKPRFKKTEHEYPVEPRIIQVVKKPKTFVDHSYRDFSQVPADISYQPATVIDRMTFAEKIYDMLNDENYANWIQWLPHGRGFRIPVPKRLEQSQVLLKYFGHNRYSSFLRQLNNHGFKHITRGVDRNSYYHECFLRGMKHLLKYMPPGRDARRLMPDPDNEPDFYAISRVCPLPDEKNPPFSQQGPIQQAPLQQQQTLDIQNLISHNVAPLSLGLPPMHSLRPTQPQVPIHQPSSFQYQGVSLQQAAALRQQADASLYSSLFKTSGLGLTQLPSLVNPTLPSQSQLDDPAVLALLLRSRAANCLFGFQG